MNINNLEFLKQYAVDCYPQEMCGALVNEVFIPIENKSDNPVYTFKFSQEDSILYSGYPIIHSHCMVTYIIDPRTPSYEDMVSAQNSDCPYGIVHCDGTNVTDVLWFNTKEVVPLLGREYISNVYDCFGLARDYYRLNYNIDFGLHPRPPDWQAWNPRYIEEHFKDCGFVEKKKNSLPVKGDILLLAILQKNINHIGIVTQQNNFIHHVYDRLSCEDTISRWHRQLRLILEYKG